MQHFLDSFRFVNALAPVANAFAGTVYPTGVNCKGIGRIAWLIIKGVGTSGTTTIQVMAGDDTSPLNESAVPFMYRRIPANNITPGSVTRATSSGFLTTAGSGDMYIVEVDAQALAASGYSYAHIKMVEGTASAVVGCVVAMCSDLRYADDTSDIVS